MSELLRSLRVGRLPYLNVHPFHVGWEGTQPCWVTRPPRRLGELAAADALDASLLASRDALALEPRFQPLGSLGIACRGPVESVLLFARRPLCRLEGAVLALTRESRTSRALLRILLRERLGVRRACFTDRVADADAWLAIGDEALIARADPRWPHRLDLGEAWTAWTGLPFVYARWVVRRDLPRAAARALAAALDASLDRGGPLPPPTQRAGLSRAAARRYLARFTYRLGPAECAGLRRFHQELLNHDLHHGPAELRRVGSAA